MASTPQHRAHPDEPDPPRSARGRDENFFAADMNHLVRSWIEDTLPVEAMDRPRKPAAPRLDDQD